MKNTKLIWKIVNSLLGILLLMYVFNVMHWFVFMKSIQNIHIAIVAVIVYLIRYWIEVRYEIGNLIKNNKLTKMIYYLSAGLFVIGVLAKVMHWSFDDISMIIGTVGILTSFILIFFIIDSNKQNTSSNNR